MTSAPTPVHLLAVALAAIVAGTLAGVVGFGGGVLLLPALTWVSRPV